MDVQFISGDENHYQLKEVISKSSTSSVYSAVDLKTEKTVCIKIIELTEQQIQMNSDYLQIWKQISPINGILGLQAYYLLLERETYFMNMVTELAVTSLDKYLNKCFEEHKYLKNNELISFIMDTLNTLVQLQHMNIAHRNLKPENILLMNVQKMEWKICDIFHSTQMNQEAQDHTQSQSLTKEFTHISPELYENFRKQNFAPDYNPFKSDLFSLGLIWIQAASFYKFSLQSRASLRGPKYQQALKNLILSVVHRYPEIHGLQEVFEMALQIQPIQRFDPIEIQKLIIENKYLELELVVKSERSIQVNNLHLKHSDEQGYKKFHIPKDFQNIEYYNTNPQLIEKAHFDLNDLCIMPNDFLLLSKKLLLISHDLKLNGLKLSFELNGIDEKHILPLQNLIAKQNLKELFIYGWNNQLRDQGLQTLLHNVQLDNMENFLLSMPLNQLTDKSMSMTIDLILKMKALRHLSLDFSMNQLTPESSLMITQLKEIKFESVSLNFQNNSVNDRLCEEIQFLQKTLKKLKLNVSSTAVSDSGLIQIGTFIEQLPNLVNLQVTAWNTSIKDKGLNEFMRSLQKTTQIQKLILVLRSNKITSEQKILGESLAMLVNLKYLEINLSSTLFGDVGTTMLTKALVNLNQIQTLVIKLEGAHLTKVACRYIGRLPANLKSLKQLTLNLSLNKLEAEGVELLSAGLRLSQNLQYLELILDSIECGNEGCNFLAEGIKKFTSCKEITIQMCKNNINTSGLMSLIETIAKFQPETLEKFVCDLSQNNIDQQTEEAVLLMFKKFKSIDIKLCDY